MEIGDQKPETPNYSEKERKERIIEDLKRILGDAQKADIFGTQNKIVKKCDELRKAYDAETLDNCRLYHLLVGSTIAEGHEPTTFDLDGQIEAFIRGLSKE